MNQAPLSGRPEQVQPGTGRNAQAQAHAGGTDSGDDSARPSSGAAPTTAQPGAEQNPYLYGFSDDWIAAVRIPDEPIIDPEDCEDALVVYRNFCIELLAFHGRSLGFVRWCLGTVLNRLKPIQSGPKQIPHKHWRRFLKDVSKASGIQITDDLAEEARWVAKVYARDDAATLGWTAMREKALKARASHNAAKQAAKEPGEPCHYSSPHTPGAQLVLADVIAHLRTLEDNSFDGVLSDPPYMIGILDAAWDSLDSAGLASNRAFQGWCLDWGRELLRVVKPGAPLLAFGSPRTYHRMVCGLEDAGWQVRNTIAYLYGQGFPKSLDIAKAIDTHLSADREILGHHNGVGTCSAGFGFGPTCPITVPASAQAKEWAGYGTGLKPAQEPIVLAVKPRDGTYANNALRHGVAGLNLSACMVGTETITVRGGSTPDDRNGTYYVNGQRTFYPSGRVDLVREGRFPSNLILGHHPDCRRIGSRQVGGHFHRHLDGTKPFAGGAGHPFVSIKTHPQVVDLHDCHTDCPIGQLGAKASYFYCAKPSTSERNMGLENRPAQEEEPIDGDNMNGHNHHETVKPIALAMYLAKLILPPPRETPRQILVPFCGTGSEIIGAVKAGWDNVVGIDNNAEYLEIARARIAHATNVNANLKE